MSALIDLTGQQFGYWKVLERAPNKKGGRSQWKCLCTKCNETIKNVDGAHLRGGRSQACTKCRQKKMAQAVTIDETGRQYGYLKVIRKATEEEKPRHDKTGAYWVCTCLNCGQQNVIVFGDYLRNGDTKSCGCLKNSWNETQIEKLLTEQSIQYKKQLSFPDLYDKEIQGRKYVLPFDFGIYYNEKLLYIIEYDGEQHFRKIAFKTSQETTHYHDLLKNKYCFEHNIPIIRIPYNEDYDIKDLKLETTRFLLTPENEGEYYAERS